MVPEPLPPIHEPPARVTQPVVRLMPFVKEEVPAPWTLMVPVVSMTPAEVVAIPTPRPPTIDVDVPTAKPTRGVGVEVEIPTTPVFVIIKFVCVDEPTTNEGPEPMLFGFTERRAQGEDVPTPRFLFIYTD